ncbi:MAG: hypothetical protein ABI655_06550 [Phenylobacterium sp.]
MTAEDCRAKATEMLSYAALSLDGAQRSEWEHMAKVWRELAVQHALQAALVP